MNGCKVCGNRTLEISSIPIRRVNYPVFICKACDYENGSDLAIYLRQHHKAPNLRFKTYEYFLDHLWMEEEPEEYEDALAYYNLEANYRP